MACGSRGCFTEEIVLKEYEVREVKAKERCDFPTPTLAGQPPDSGRRC
jgi:hypothetical protein